MKLKKTLSLLLAAVMAFGLLCTPALAASLNDVEKTLDEGSLWVDMAQFDRVERNVSVSLRLLDWDRDKAAFTKRADVLNHTILTLPCLPLGVTFTAGPNFSMDHIYVYSDPDGDGVYEQRLERDTWYGEGEDEDYDFEVVPLSEPGPFTWTDNVEYASYFEWGPGNDWLEWDMGAAVYRTLSTDYLVELFGANSIVEFTDGEYSSFWLLTGENRGGNVADNKIENYGVSVSMAGYLTSTWASQTADLAYLYDLIPPTVQRSHNYNLRGEITRSEFATVAMYLYSALANTNEFTRPSVSPFVDVNESDPNYIYILGAYQLGFVNGTSTVNKTFSPNSLVTRQDAAVMLARVYEKVGGTIPAAASTSFADDNQISSYAKAAVAFMSSKGIINGVGSNRFSPKGNASVEQALKIALEMLNTLG